MEEMSLRMEIFVAELQRSLDFYHNVLGFEILHADAGYAALRAGAVQLGLGPAAGLGADHYFVPEVTTGRKGVGVEIVLEVDDVDGLYRRVLDAAYPVETALGRRFWGLTDFRLADPDGYYLRITSRS